MKGIGRVKRKRETRSEGIVYPMTFRCVSHYKLMPNNVQTHATSFEIYVEIPEFPRIPNIASLSFGETCKNMMHKVLSFIKHNSFNDWLEQAVKEFICYFQSVIKKYFKP